MSKNKHEEVVSFFPQKRLISRFLAVTMLLMFGTAISLITIFNTYLSVSPGVMVGILSFTSVVFCLINFQVTRGSFLCANILKYYSLILILICFPSLFIGDSTGKLIFSLLNTVLLLSSWYLISSKNYQSLIQFQKDYFDDLREAHEAVEHELNKNRKQGKKPK